MGCQGSSLRNRDLRSDEDKKAIIRRKAVQEVTHHEKVRNLEILVLIIIVGFR